MSIRATLLTAYIIRHIPLSVATAGASGKAAAGTFQHFIPHRIHVQSETRQLRRGSRIFGWNSAVATSLKARMYPLKMIKTPSTAAPPTTLPYFARRTTRPSIYSSEGRSQSLDSSLHITILARYWVYIRGARACAMVYDHISKAYRRWWASGCLCVFI